VQTGAAGLVEARSGLLTAHTLWRGLKRGINDAARGEFHYAYVLSPHRDWIFEPTEGPVEEDPPEQCVFMVIVEFPPTEDPRLAEWQAICPNALGMIHDWDWCLADTKQTDQPMNPELRFEDRVWTKQDEQPRKQT
jgi:hypothetical protein